MARGDIKVGDVVAVTAIVRGRVTPDRISVTIPSYAFPHSVVDPLRRRVIGQLTGHLTRIDGDKGDHKPPAVGGGRRRACPPGGKLRPAQPKTPLVRSPSQK